MKDILQNWNAYTGKTRLTESQKNKLRIRHRELHNNGSLDLIFESNFDNVFESVSRWQKLYQDGCQILNEKVVLEVLNYRICLESLREARRKEKKHNPLNEPTINLLRTYRLPPVQPSRVKPDEAESVDEYFKRILGLEKTGNLDQDEQAGLDGLRMMGVIPEDEDEEEQQFDPFSNLKSRAVVEDEIPGYYDSPTETCYLQFSEDNSKLSNLNVVAFALPVGYTCKFAGKCLTFVEPLGKDEEGKYRTRLKHGPKTEKECFMAGIEQRSPEYRDKVWYNAYLLSLPIAIAYSNKGLLASIAADPSELTMHDLIVRSIKNYRVKNPGRMGLVRIHAGGDFWSQEYFDAWLKAAQVYRDIIFYAYTTSIEYWVARKNQIPPNFILIASMETRTPELVYHHALRSAKIFDTPDEAAKAGLQIDVNEFEAIFGESDFALLLHGVRQRAGDVKVLKMVDKDGIETELKVSKSTLAKLNSKLITYLSKKYVTDPKAVAEAVEKILLETKKWYDERMQIPADPNDPVVFDRFIEKKKENDK